MEQPIEAGNASTENGSSSLDDILAKGLEGIEAAPTDGDQPGADEESNQPETVEGTEGKQEQPTEQETAEELFAELLLEDEKKLSFKDKQALESWIEKNLPAFEKTGHFMRQADYTRKTQALKQEREEWEQQKAESDSFWGEVKPDEDSLGAFKTLWDVFTNGDDSIKSQINSFMQDAYLLANGKLPKGPLAAVVQGQQASFNPEIIRLNRELQKLRSEHERGQSETQRTLQAERMREAETTWKSWVKAKESAGSKISEELEKAMVPFIAAQSHEIPAEERLETAYELAVKKLGLSGKEAVQKVFKSTQDAKKKNPAPVSSKADSEKEPDVKDLSEIFSYGQKKLAG